MRGERRGSDVDRYIAWPLLCVVSCDLDVVFYLASRCGTRRGGRHTVCKLPKMDAGISSGDCDDVEKMSWLR